MNDAGLLPRTAPAALAPVGLFDFLCGRWARFAVVCGECGHQFLATVDPRETTSACCPACGLVNVWFQPKPPARPAEPPIALRSWRRAFLRLWDRDDDDSGGAVAA